ncbi:MAG TPA: methyltransferase domain-containing protein [Chloroflexia bacterium]|nr:methyltransferase domain-containing protein [Chloroflexia bacterium]
MPKWTAEEKETYRNEVMRRIMEGLPVAEQEYSQLDWETELQGYRTDHEYYPDYIHAPIHGSNESYTTAKSCMGWDVALEPIIELSHKVTVHEMREKMASLIPADARIESVLELGAGTAEGALALARRFPEAHYTITDVSPYMLVISKHKFKQAGMLDHASFEQVDARSTGYPNNSFDLVTASLLFHETPKEWTPVILKEMYRITKPGGWVLYCDTYRGQYALNASFPEPWLSDFIHFNFEYEFARAGFDELDYIRHAVGLWYMVGRKPLEEE